MRKIKNGDVFDINQTVNGVSKFLWFNDKWYYFEERMTREYEYDQKDLTDLVKNINETEDVKLLRNILENQFTEEDLRKAIELTRKEIKVPYEINGGNVMFDYCYYSDEEIIDLIKKLKL